MRCRRDTAPRDVSCRPCRCSRRNAARRRSRAPPRRSPGSGRRVCPARPASRRTSRGSGARRASCRRRRTRSDLRAGALPLAGRAGSRSGRDSARAYARLPARCAGRDRGAGACALRATGRRTRSARSPARASAGSRFVPAARRTRRRAPRPRARGRARGGPGAGAGRRDARVPTARGRAPAGTRRTQRGRAARARGSSCLLPEFGAEPLERSRESRLDGATPAAERRRGLVFGEVEEVAARDCLAVVLLETVDRREQLLAPLGAEERRLGGRGRVPRGDLPGRAQGERLATAGCATAVARLVRDDPQQPGLEGRAGAKAPERAVRLHEAVLGSLFGVGGVAGDEPCGTEGDALVCAHEFLVSGRVSPLRAGDELRFGHSSRPTTAAYTPGLSTGFLGGRVTTYLAIRGREGPWLRVSQASKESTSRRGRRRWTRRRRSFVRWSRASPAIRGTSS